MRSTRGLFLALLGLVLLAAPGNAHAMGKGRTKKSFNAYFQTPEKNRVFFKCDVEAAILALENTGSSTRNDDLANMDLTVTINGTAFTETLDEKGKANTDVFKAKLTANGRILQVKLKDLDLQSILPLDPADDGKNLTVDVTLHIEAQPQPENSEDPLPPAIVLVDEVVTFKYSQKADNQAKGKNF